MKKSTLMLAILVTGFWGSEQVVASQLQTHSQLHPQAMEETGSNSGHATEPATAAGGLSEDTSGLLLLPQIQYVQPQHPERLSLGTVLTVSDESSVAKNLTNTGNPSIFTTLGESTNKFLNALGVDTSQPGPLSRFGAWLSIKTIDDKPSTSGQNLPQAHPQVASTPTAHSHDLPRVVATASEPTAGPAAAHTPGPAAAPAATTSAVKPSPTIAASQSPVIPTPAVKSSQELKTGKQAVTPTPALTLKAELMSAEVTQRPVAQTKSVHTPVSKRLSADTSPPDTTVAMLTGTKPAPTLTPHEKELLFVSPTHYTLVLFDSALPGDANRFVTAHGLSNKARIYHHKESGVDHYEVVMGDYADLNSSLLAVAELPASLQRYSPDSQRYSVIQARITA